MTNEQELQEGTALATCANCKSVFVVMEEFKDVTHYCSKECNEEHSLFNLESLK
ncbi:MAG: hypothetical protein KBT36_13890 [Kurthia sp.]|nr:hypothetical protein [Candidatus Kurthia equi]